MFPSQVHHGQNKSVWLVPRLKALGQREIFVYGLKPATSRHLTYHGSVMDQTHARGFYPAEEH